MKTVIKRSIIALVLLIAVLASSVLYYTFYTKIDTYYAVKFGDVLSGCDIRQMDKYLSEDTVIYYQEQEKTYNELRQNVVDAFLYGELTRFAGYGHGDGFTSGIQEIAVYYGGKCSEKIISDEMTMSIRMTSPFTFKVEYIKSDNEFIGYLFYGIGF